MEWADFDSPETVPDDITDDIRWPETFLFFLSHFVWLCRRINTGRFDRENANDSIVPR